jgi:NAD(P)-dependent dehydrogenase (short-subunit alcohol dehydrogenase family)/pimeloyl-ACP methyl ester carboxylesterase
LSALGTRTVTSGRVRIALVEGGDVARPTIVFVHGYPDTKELWGPVMAQLQSRFHVVAFDLRGFGGSSAPRGPRAYSLERLADDLDAVTAAVAADKRVHLVGHDWGGIAGWDFATSGRFEGTLASLTSVAGPSLDQISSGLRETLRRGRVLAALGRLWRSWYVVPMLMPGAPSITWTLLGRRWWAWFLQKVERVPVAAEYPGATVKSDGRHGANLYRANVPPKLLRPRLNAGANVPVQLIVPSGDHFISPSYYVDAERHAPRVRRRIAEGSHWSPRRQPELVAKWVGEFVEDVEAGDGWPSRRPWVRGGGVEQLQGRLALVTGAGSGIGRATAIALARHGARLLLVDRDQGTASQTAESIPGAHVFACDVSDGEAMERLASTVLGEHGVPDVVVNNAGIAVAGRFVDTDFSQWRRVLDVNLMGVVHGCRLFGRAMVERGEGGQIVNTASAAAFAPSKELPAYAASKAAVLMLSECLRAELGASGIGVTAVCPGFIATNITQATVYVGRAEQEQQRLRDYVTQTYRRRNFTPEQVAAEIVDAIGVDRPVAVVTPEARAFQLLSRFAPRLLRRIAAVDALPI